MKIPSLSRGAPQVDQMPLFEPAKEHSHGISPQADAGCLLTCNLQEAACQLTGGPFTASACTNQGNHCRSNC